ncbi:MAG: cytochrome c-type biogenesis protein CcmH [Dehalococcoidia bacterium]|nr:cytochrome c-type biogenesis protein CcmH [Dehalococcoidia bacterium]
MKILFGLILSGLLLVALAAHGSPARAETTYDSVAIELMCQCGCGKVLSACDMPECSTQKQMNEQVRTMIGQGKGKDEIVQYFVASYGEKVLAAPTKQGFNLAAWLMPFAVIAGGLGFVYFAVDKWVFQRRGGSSEDDEALEDVAPAELGRYEQRLKKELEKHDEGGA